ncbi:MAG: type II secretion system protein GspL, partial [Desulfobacterales bacterium]|nr:type II secretion system protein GspL [Desulfobacterales bacterium]
DGKVYHHVDSLVESAGQVKYGIYRDASARVNKGPWVCGAFNGLRSRRIETFAYVPIADAEDKDHGIQTALETIAGRIDTRTTVCVAVIATPQVFYRRLRVPFTDEKKIRQVLPFELEPTLPVPVESLIVDFQTIPATAGEGLLATAVERSVLAFYLEKLAAVRIEPARIVAGGYCTALCVGSLAGSPEDFLLADLSDGWCTLFVLRSHQIAFVRSFAADAESPTGAETFGRHIRHTLSAFGAAGHDSLKPARLMLSGGGTGAKAFAEKLERMLSLAVGRVDLGSELQSNVVTVRGSGWDPARLDGALAAAMAEGRRLTRFNFRRGPLAPTSKWARHRRRLRTAAILAVLLLGLFFLDLILENHRLGERIHGLDGRIQAIFAETLPQTTKMVDPVQQLRVKIQELKGTSVFPAESVGSPSTLRILDEISRRIDPGIEIQLTSAIIGGDGVLLSGNTDTFNAVDEIKNRLESADIFKSVTISSATLDNSGKAVNFKLRMQLAP